MDFVDRLLSLDTDYRNRLETSQWIAREYAGRYTRYRMRPHADLAIAGQRALISAWSHGPEHIITEATFWLFLRSPNPHYLHISTRRIRQIGTRRFMTGNSEFDENCLVHTRDEGHARRLVNSDLQRTFLALCGAGFKPDGLLGTSAAITLSLHTDRARLECHWYRSDLAPPYAEFHRHTSRLFELL